MVDEPAITEEEYSAVEEQLYASSLGRDFLRRRDEHMRAVALSEFRSLAADLRKCFSGTAPDIHRDDHVHILRRELQEMSAHIEQTRHEIAAIRPDEPSNNRILKATGELDAIVSATERATSDILMSAERVQEIVTRIRDEGVAANSCDELEAQATQIFMACSSQDITGQRTNKVVDTLRYLEHRINAMVKIWGVDGVDPAEIDSDETEQRPDANLLNGPALSDGINQGDIDALMAG